VKGIKVPKVDEKFALKISGEEDDDIRFMRKARHTKFPNIVSIYLLNIDNIEENIYGKSGQNRR
jgi:hypothetical protein